MVDLVVENGNGLHIAGETKFVQSLVVCVSFSCFNVIDLEDLRNPMNFWMGEAQSKNGSASYDGAIFLCNHLTRKECFEKKLLGLSAYCADYIQKVKTGATLFLYDVEQCKLHGVFEATSDGAMNIIPDAYISSGKLYPSQIRFKRIWFCKPLMESEFQDAVQNNFMARNKFSYGLSHQQVVNLLHLFSSRNRLQPRQNPSLHDELPRESEVSSLVNQTDIQSSPNSSSHGSFKSPCQTCFSSTLGEHAASLIHKLTNPMSLVQRELQSYISDVAKSNSSRSSLHTGANADSVTVPDSQEAMDDKSIDDYIPLPLEEDTLESVDDLSDLLEDESHSSESKGSSDSEEHTTFHQACERKEDGFYPPMVNSKLHSDSEGRTSVFSRLMGRPKTFSLSKKSKTKSFPSKNAQSFNPLSQRKQQWRTQRNKPYPYDNDGTANRLSRVTALDYSFVWGDNRKSTKSSGGKPSKIQTRLAPFVEDGKKWDVSAKEPGRYDACKKLFVPEGSRKLFESCDRELNTPPVFAGLHESSEVHVKEQIRTPFLDFKRRAKDPSVEGGDQDFGNEDVEQSAGKKRRLASASFPQEEYLSDTALVPKGTNAMYILAISDGNCKDKSITLSSKDTCTQMARAYLGTKVILQDEQQESIQGCCEQVTGDASLILENSETMGLLPKHSFGDRKTFSNVETQSEVASGHPENETSFQEKQNQSVRSHHGVVNTDNVLLLENSEAMDFLPNHDEYCGSKRSLSSDGNLRHVASSHLSTEMPLQEKQTPSVQSCSQVVHGDKVFVPENSEEMFPKFDAACGNKKGLSSDEAYSHVEASHLDSHVSLQEKPYQRAPSCCEIVNADRALVLENSVTLDISPKCDGECGKNSLPSDGIGGYVASDHMASNMFLGRGQYESIQTKGNTMLALGNSIPMDTLQTIDGDSGNKGNSLVTCTNLGFDYMKEVRQLVRNCHEVVSSDAAPVPESSGSLRNFRKCHGDSANKYSLLDETSENVATDHQETGMLPHDEHYHSCCGDTSSVLEYSGTMDTSTGDGDSEHKNSFDQKDDEIMYSVTGSEDHGTTTYTLSSNGNQCCAPPDDQECSKVVLHQEVQYQNFRSRPETAHENPNFINSFTVCAEGCRSKSRMSAVRTSGHLATDLLGTNSESRTSFFNDSSSECTENFSSSALSSEKILEQNANGSEVSAEVTILQHDPGEEMKPR